MTETVAEKRIEALLEKVTALEKEIRNERKKMELFYSQSNFALWEYDIGQGRMNRFKELQGGWSRDHSIVENYRETIRKLGIVHPQDVIVFEDFCDSMDRGDAEIAYELRVLTDMGGFTWVRIIANAAYDESGRPIQIVGKTLDISEERKSLEKSEIRATQDSLTGLYNKDATINMISQCIAEPEIRSGALLIIDIDDFKRINEKYGQLYGDSVLERMGRTLFYNFSSRNIIGRISGDSFVIFAMKLSSKEEAQNLADRVVQRVHESIKLKDNTSITLSIGIAMYPKDGESAEALLQNADIALYYVKNNPDMISYFYSNDLKKELDARTDGTRFGKLAASEEFKRSYQDQVAKELFDFAFDIINREVDFEQAADTILSEVGLYLGLDRANMAVFDMTRQSVELCSYWRRENDGDDAAWIEAAFARNWKLLEQLLADQEYCITTNSKIGSYDFSREIADMVKPPGISLLFPIMDKNKMIGTLNYELWNEERRWEPMEIATLSSITKMLAGYMLRSYSQMLLQTETLYTGLVMDSLQAMYYAVDKKTQRITYISRYATEGFPHVRLGDLCYKAIRGQTSPCRDCPIHKMKADPDSKTASVETYQEQTDAWYTITATEIDKAYVEEQYLICWIEVTSFLSRVKATDQLTGAFSYDRFRVEALRMLAKKNKDYVLVFMGIKDFAIINDDFGFEAGDRILIATIHTLQSMTLKSELVCRVKGDDFIMLLERDEQVPTRDRVRRGIVAITQIVQNEYPNIDLRCFAGIYDIRDQENSFSIDLDKVQIARKRAEDNYYDLSGIYVYSVEDEKNEEARRLMEQQLRHALEQERFSVYFQPKVDIFTGKIVGAEALVRMLDDRDNIIPPGLFISLAEQNGLIKDIDLLVYRKTFEQISEWMRQGKKVPYISMNLSRINLLNDEVLHKLRGMLAAYGLSADQIELEITESVFFDDQERLIFMIQELRKMGFGISMDDFGAGYSTLGLMTSLPMDTLKIDSGFFLRSKLDSKNKAIISAIINLAKNLNLYIVAEGIETKEQVEFLKEQDCSCVQGYYFYKPMPAAEFEKLF